MNAKYQRCGIHWRLGPQKKKKKRKTKKRDRKEGKGGERKKKGGDREVTGITFRKKTACRPHILREYLGRPK